MPACKSLGVYVFWLVTVLACKSLGVYVFRLVTVLACKSLGVYVFWLGTLCQHVSPSVCMCSG